MTDELEDMPYPQLAEAFEKVMERVYDEDKEPTQEDLKEYYELHKELWRRAYAKGL